MGYTLCSCSNKWDNATEFLIDRVRMYKNDISVTNVLNNIDKLFKPKGLIFTPEEREFLRTRIMMRSIKRLQKAIRNFVKIKKTLYLKSVYIAH